MAESDDRLEVWCIARGIASEEQILAYCELMGIEPTAEVSQRLRGKTPMELLVRACRSHRRPVPQPTDAVRERFDRAFRWKRPDST